MTDREPNIDGVLITPLKIIPVPGGDVLRGIKPDDPGFLGFGEAYFSTINKGAIKAWKRHREMTMNLIVPIGAIRFVICEEYASNQIKPYCQEFVLSRENYCCLTVPPMVWMGFEGVGDQLNMLLNVSNITHHADEMDRLPVNKINFDWEK